jgi:hypothetical protein
MISAPLMSPATTKQSAYLLGSPASREKMRAFSVDTFSLIA